MTTVCLDGSVWAILGQFWVHRVPPNLVIRLIKVDKVGKNEPNLKSSDQSVQNDQSGHGEKE